jgi:hypothetical protein
MTTEAITPLRQRMIEDMNSRKLCAHTQRGHIYSWKRLAAFLKRSPETATCEDLRLLEPHSITSSARARSVGGSVRPSALAVLRLITSSYFVGICTGRSAGFSPLRMRST